MSVEVPTPSQLRDIADEVGLTLTDGDVTSFIELMRPTIDAYNAVEAMPNGGRLEVSAGQREESVEITVADTGVGIEPELLDRIFDLYVTTKSKGSGIGLSVVYRIVQLHGGEITVQSRQGEGTRFVVRLPQVPE